MTTVRTSFSSINPVSDDQGGVSLTPVTNVLYVDSVHGSNSTGTGSESQPYATLSKAATELGGSGCIVAAQGSTFTETVSITSGTVNIVAPSQQVVWNGSLNINSGVTVTLDGFQMSATNSHTVYVNGIFNFKNCTLTTTFDNTYSFGTVETILCDECLGLTDLGNNTVSCQYSNTGSGTPTPKVSIVHDQSVTNHANITLGNNSVYNIYSMPFVTTSSIVYQAAYTPAIAINVIVNQLQCYIYDDPGALSTFWLFLNNGRSFFDISNVMVIVASAGASDIGIGLHDTSSHAVAGSYINANSVTYLPNLQPDNQVFLGAAGTGTFLNIQGTFFAATNVFPAINTTVTGGTITYSIENNSNNSLSTYAKTWSSQAFSTTDTIVVNHGFNTFPLNVQAVDATNTTLAITSVQYNSASQFTVTLGGSNTGTVYFIP